MTTRGHHGILLVPSGPPPITWNPSDKGAQIVLSNSDLTMAGSGGIWNSVRSTLALTSGKWYDEGLLGSSIGTSGCPIFGVCTAGYSLATFIGSGAGGWGIQGKGASNVIRTFLAGSSADRTGVVNTGERVKMAIDIGAGQGWFAEVGGAWIGGGDPAAGTSPTFTFTGGTTLYAAASAFNSGGGFGTLTRVGGSYTDTVPSGFTGIG